MTEGKQGAGSKPRQEPMAAAANAIARQNPMAAASEVIPTQGLELEALFRRHQTLVMKAAYRVTGSMNGQHVYMLYLAVPGADSPAILINYRPPGKGAASDDAAWQHFLDSIEVAAKAN